MSNQAPEFDLRRFAPPTGVNVTFRSGVSYRLPGDPDVDDVAILLRLETQINDTAGADLATVLIEAKDTLKRLILSVDPDQDISGLKVGPEELLVIFALLVHGSTVAEAVGRAITAHNTQAGESLDATDLSDEQIAAQERAVEAGDPGPLSRSPSSSSGLSSGSDDAEQRLSATG